MQNASQQNQLGALNKFNAMQQQYFQQLMGLRPGQIVASAAQEMIPQKAAKPLPHESVLCATGGIVAWREWRVPCFGSKLSSINGTAWPIREALKAACRNGDTHCRGENCDCGIYAWKKREDLKVNDSTYSYLRGEVWLWGKIVEHELGYRAEFAYPKAFVRSADAERLASIYGVKIL